MMNLYKTLVNNNQQYSPYFHNGFSNHYPMVLYCIKAMGGSEETMQYQGSEERWDYYHKKYDLPFELIEVSKNEINNDNWKSFMGNYAHFPDFYTWIKENKVIENEELYTSIINELKHYLTAALFHPTIRYAMAIDEEYKEEEELALAYWLSSAGDRPNIEQTQEEYIDNLNALLNDFQFSASFVSLHYITGFVAINTLPENLKNTFLPYYNQLLADLVKENNYSTSPASLTLASEEEIQSAKEVAFKSVDDHVVKGIYALIELNKMGEFKHIPECLEKLKGLMY